MPRELFALLPEGPARQFVLGCMAERAGEETVALAHFRRALEGACPSPGEKPTTRNGAACAISLYDCAIWRTAQYLALAGRYEIWLG